MGLTNPATGAVKSVQSGLAVIGSSIASGSAAITAVNLSKAVLTFSAYNDASNTAPDACNGYFVNSTTLQFDRITASGSMQIRWFVTEYF